MILKAYISSDFDAFAQMEHSGFVDMCLFNTYTIRNKRGNTELYTTSYICMFNSEGCGARAILIPPSHFGAFSKSRLNTDFWVRTFNFRFVNQNCIFQCTRYIQRTWRAVLTVFQVFIFSRRRGARHDGKIRTLPKEVIFDIHNRIRLVLYRFVIDFNSLLCTNSCARYTFFAPPV